MSDPQAFGVMLPILAIIVIGIVVLGIAAWWSARDRRD
jgi:hypothetical protein